MTKVIAPGGRLGVLGSGQLGRMFALAARRLGYRVIVYSPDQDSPTGQVADTEFTARYDDLERVKAFARTVDVVTFEFENVPFPTAAACAQYVPVRPRGEVLHITQQRLREKTYLREQGFPVTPFARVTSLAELEAAIDALGLPAVLKSADFGYDGKGQRKLLARADAPAAWAALGVKEAILEGFVDFALEVSVVAARGLDGSFAAFDVFENAHANHILDVTVCPARIEPKLARQALELARGILERLDVVGVLCVEMFVTKSGALLVNELAPRPHNSGHLTFDASLTNQFEQQVRAVCGLPLGSPQSLRPAAMMNLLGDVWANGEPHWAAALELPNVKLHLYGKSDPRPGRKMGHLTALADTVDDAERAVREARARLVRRDGPR
ncbi:MAG: 5-(carboxyamino)imidazole ribonucleotide synthase [Planctomycetes bacterium]|nr:5-(carboxyamino)imidazole ribonucleotide synthase [Planctomycetota bacterium]